MTMFEAKKIMKEDSAQYFSNRACQYFPCHQAADGEDFNCLFCYCPLYALGDQCGGHFRYTDKGVKDCTACTIPHSAGGYEYVMTHIRAVTEMTRRREAEEQRNQQVEE